VEEIWADWADGGGFLGRENLTADFLPLNPVGTSGEVGVLSASGRMGADFVLIVHYGCRDSFIYIGLFCFLRLRWKW